MEVPGVVFRPLHGGHATHVRHSCSSFPSSDKIHLRFLSLKPFPKKRSSVSSNLSLVSTANAPGFCDNGHVEYYDGLTTATCGVGMKKKEKEKEKEISSKKKTMKKKLKLLKGLSKNLSSFSDMGFGLDPDHGLADQVKGKMISEAADLLLVQLQQLRAEEMELKSKKKEEKANKLKNRRMQKRMGCENTSSSSSSESTDSECGEEVVDMNRLKATMTGTSLVSNGLQPPAINQEATEFVLPSMDNIQARLPAVAPYSSEISNENCCSSGNITSFEGNVGSNDRNRFVVEASGKKIEVCMGGKCKKSGAGLLLDEFRKAVGGGEGAVVGCKCMGKCRDGPNVRVKYPETETVLPSNPLWIGVGLEDVSLIVSNYFGGEHHSELGLAQPAAS